MLSLRRILAVLFLLATLPALAQTTGSISGHVLLTSRGGEGRTPSNDDADVHLGYLLAIHNSQLNILLDVFNFLNTQRAVLLDQRYSFQESDNFLAKSANPGYLKPIVRTPALSARLGLRWAF